MSSSLVSEESRDRERFSTLMIRRIKEMAEPKKKRKPGGELRRVFTVHEKVEIIGEIEVGKSRTNVCRQNASSNRRRFPKCSRKSCRLHYDKSPVKMVRANRQYMYDDNGIEFLDCVSNVSLVGHCHPSVVAETMEQMEYMMSGDVHHLQNLIDQYRSQLLSTLPDTFNVCFLFNSGSEANDVAIQMARAYTKREDIVVVDGSFHGGLEMLSEINQNRTNTNCSLNRKDYVHVVPLPDDYRGKHVREDPHVAEKYVQDSLAVMSDAIAKGRQIACFISEPIFTCSGVVIPTDGYLNSIYDYVHNCGGLCISDENQTGFGRTGSNFWGFQSQDVIPDIVTIGKPIGNGYPMAAILTRTEIASALPNLENLLELNPVAHAVGLSVLKAMSRDKVIANVVLVSDVFLGTLRDVMRRHRNIGDIRGVGLIIGIDVVIDKTSCKPAPNLAEKIVYRLKDEAILMAADGPFKNVLCLMPPLCFTCDNAMTFIYILDKIFSEIDEEQEWDIDDDQFHVDQLDNSRFMITQMPSVIPIDVILNTGAEMEGNSWKEEPVSKRLRFEDID